MIATIFISDSIFIVFGVLIVMMLAEKLNKHLNSKRFKPFKNPKQKVFDLQQHRRYHSNFYNHQFYDQDSENVQKLPG